MQNKYYRKNTKYKSIKWCKYWARKYLKKLTKIKKNIDIVVPLKYLNNFWKTLDIPLINCEVSLILTWSENCVLTDIKIRTARGTRVAVNAPTNATFKITDVKLYVSVAALSTENDKTLLEQLKNRISKNY